ncbi:SDR family oxidoreductase [Gordonia jinhuaensis]|uniref:SDR family oxidoreductase n=1 Tax=Gordonia jinhuaensis TaxID=1517702 RepID=A0A916WQT3_9ACTN|nr:SDR family NAD(P)-dependent oxidoreductase [Gordonia jinhuaensis]GGB20904.1 SDR family oxidoreductase [Gordonia jinhuaensis]
MTSASSDPTTTTSAGSDPTISPGDAKVAVVTGASSGIGEATAKELAAQGFHVVVGARRFDRVSALAREIGGTAVELDITDQSSVDALVAALPRVDVLVNNAGGAKGMASVADAVIDDWTWMWETNVLGTLRITKALLPGLIASGDGLIVTVTSTAALEAYDNGAGYTSAKHAEAVLHRTLRLELLGQPVRLTEVCPGMVETEFSMVRFGGDQARADAVYEGLTPLIADDIAEIIGFVASRPSRVNLDQIVVRPRDQATSRRNIKTG